jgi:hypothetical protein
LTGSYKQLILVWYGIRHSATGSKFPLRINADSGSNYVNISYQQENSSVGINDATTTGIFNNDHAAPFGWNANGGALQQDANGYIVFENPFSTSKLKYYHAHTNFLDNQNGAWRESRSFGVWNSTSAITEINVYRASGSATFSNATNTSIRLYGVS